MKNIVFKVLLCGAVLLGAAGRLQAQPAPVRIGLLSDVGGPFSALGGAGSCIAAKMAVEDFGPEVLARKVEILCADHQNKVDVASAIARNWIDTQGVTAFADMASSGVALAVQQLATQSGKAIVMTSASGTEELVNAQCSPVGALWAWNTRTQAIGAVRGIMQGGGGKSWFFVTVDYVFGRALERDAAAAVKDGGGTVIGSVAFPLNTSDFSSYLLQAQASGAEVIALAAGGTDLVNAIKQAGEFHITDRQRLASFITFLTDIDGLGLERAKGLTLTTAFYWDRNDETRTWSRRFAARHGAMPTMVQASVYSSVLHYLRAVQAAATTSPLPVMAKMRATPIDDVFVTGGRLREDGLMLHDMLVVQVKAPAESKERWDDYRIVGTLPAAEAYWPLSESRCPLVKDVRP